MKKICEEKNKWSTENIELIYYILAYANSTKTINKNNLIMFFREISTQTFLNKTDFHIKNSPYQIVECEVKGIKTLKIIKEEIGEILEIINDKKSNFIIGSIMNCSIYTIAEKEIFALQKPYYKELKKFIKQPNSFISLDLSKLNRKIQAFVRH